MGVRKQSRTDGYAGHTGGHRHLTNYSSCFRAARKVLKEEDLLSGFTCAVSFAATGIPADTKAPESAGLHWFRQCLRTTTLPME